MHQEVIFLKIGEKLLTDTKNGPASAGESDDENSDGPARPPCQWRQERGRAKVRLSRRRLTMFSRSMIASSTTSPSAITSPAMTIVFSVAPIAVKISVAAINDSGIAVRLSAYCALICRFGILYM